MKSKKSVISLLFMFISLASVSTFAQTEKKEEPRHQIMYKPLSLETPELLMEVVDVNSQKDFCKMKLLITNKTDDIILYKPEETEFIYSFGTVHPKAGGMFKGKYEVVQPKSKGTRVITVSGDTRFLVTDFSLSLKGFYRISAQGDVQKAENFKLPASSNDFTAGKFKCLMTNISKETKQTAVKFKATYSGDKAHVGLVDIGKPVLKIEDGREFAMANSKDKIVLLNDGEDEKFSMFFEIPAKIVDMQFATMNIVWKNTFRESVMKAFSIYPQKIQLDPEATDAKN